MLSVQLHEVEENCCELLNSAGEHQTFTWPEDNIIRISLEIINNIKVLHGQKKPFIWPWRMLEQLDCRPSWAVRLELSCTVPPLPGAGRSGRMCVPALPAACGRWPGGFLHSSAGSTPFCAVIHSSQLLLIYKQRSSLRQDPPRVRRVLPDTGAVVARSPALRTLQVKCLLCQTVTACWLSYLYNFLVLIHLQ